MDTRTRTHPHAHDDPPPAPAGGGSDLDVTTLMIAALASAAAAFVTSQVWQGGTLLSAAISPVIVALVKEGLSRPAKRVRTVRLARPDDRTVRQDTTRRRTSDGTFAPAPSDDLTPITVYSGGGGDGRAESRWSPRRIRIALITGLLAFAAVVVVFTVPELVSGSSIGGGGSHRTTLFGGTATKRKSATRDKARSKATPTPTPAAGAEGTPTPTATPSVTPTASPTATAPPGVEGVAPTVTASPAAPTAPAPSPTP
jgi:hypothetical protein